MSYVRPRRLEERGPLGCGAGCNCGPCRTSGHGIGERYIADDEEEEPDPPTPATAAPPAPTGDVAGGELGFDADVQAEHPRTRMRCVASERRIRPVIEPPAGELVDVDVRYLLSREKRILHRTAYEAYRRLKAAAEADGLPPDILKVISGYRSVEHQKRLWAEALKKYGTPELTRPWVAPPGGSPHHTGRAIDFFLGTRNNSENIPALRATAAYKWLVCNASRFGFFPYAREPWHWEYNPGGPSAPAAAPTGGPSWRDRASRAVRWMGVARGLNGYAGYGRLAAQVQTEDPRTRLPCVAGERRIRPVIEPPASELVDVDPRYVLNRSKRVLHRSAYEAYRRLKAAAEAAGLPPNMLKIISGYRGVEQQSRLWAAALQRYGSPDVARRWVAPPGGSPHHTGRAIDFFLGTQNSSTNIPALRATDAYRWLVCNASRFGFFPYAREPWHWEFNPGNGATAPRPSH